MQIAIDGPAGAGKSTVARDIAAQLGIHYLDTGAMYRAVACWLQDDNIDTKDVDTIVARLPVMDMNVEYSGSDELVFVNGRNMMPFIRTERAALGASNVAVIREVREKLVALQRQVAQKYDVVMDGRDIGSYVLPHADFKFYLTASVQARAKRRCQDLKAAGTPYDMAEIEKEIEKRDQQDMGRVFAPLKRTADQIEINTTHMTQQEAAERILEIIRQAKTS